MIYLIVGRTGSGKDYLAKKLTDKGLKQVISYATRPKRTENEASHIFITPEEAETFTDKVATTVINGYEYFATAKQVEESDIYIIDPNGIDVLVQNMPDTEFQIIYVKADDDMNRKINAVKRADDKIKEEQVFAQRNEAEDEQFSTFEDKIFSRMDAEVCFPNNINTVLIYTNDYSDENITKYAEKLINRKSQIEHMASVVSECLDLGILEKADQNDVHGNVKVQSFTEDENGKVTATAAVTQEHCAIRVIGNVNDFSYIVGQWLALSKKFE